MLGDVPGMSWSVDVRLLHEYLFSLGGRGRSVGDGDARFLEVSRGGNIESLSCYKDLSR